MDVVFKNQAYYRLEVDCQFTLGLPHEVVSAYRRRIRYIRSMRLNAQWRLILQLLQDQKVLIVQDNEMSFPPSLFLQEEIDERGWDLARFAQEAGLALDDVLALFNGAPVTAQVAEGISRAFGTGPEIWLNLQKMHDDDAGNKGSQAFG